MPGDVGAALLLEAPASEIAEGGDELLGRGLVLREAGSGRVLGWDNARLAAFRARVVKVAGISWRFEDVQGQEFAPGCALELVAEPSNPHDRNAVGIWDAGGRTQAGYVPRGDAIGVSRALSQGSLEAFCVWEWRDEQGRRSGMRVLIAPTGTVRLRP